MQRAPGCRANGLTQRLADSGLGTYEAQRQAYARFYRVVRDQAQTLAFIDTYWLLAAAAAVMVAVALRLKKNDPWPVVRSSPIDAGGERRAPRRARLGV